MQKEIGMTAVFIGLALIDAGLLTYMLDDPIARRSPVMSGLVYGWAYGGFPILCAGMIWLVWHLKDVSS